MNCREGDLAVVIAANVHKDIIGTIVRVIQWVPDGTVISIRNGSKLQRAADCDTWLVEGQKGLWLHSDKRLRPIRDNDGEDETLTWAGKPEKVTP